jgi:hypothetical protein
MKILEPKKADIDEIIDHKKPLYKKTLLLYRELK